MLLSLAITTTTIAAIHPRTTKSRHLDRLRRLPASKDPILTRRTSSESRLGGRLRSPTSSGSREAAEMAGVGSFGTEKPPGLGDSGEADAILEGGSADSRCDSAWDHVESSLNRMSKWLVAGIFAFVILWKHDAEVMWAAMGSVVNSLLSVTLKRILNHERPTPALRSDPGMPSSHAQSIFYAAIFAVLSLFLWLGTNYLTLTSGAAILAFGSYLSWLRVSQRLHSLDQVLVGTAVGTAFGAIWFLLWHLLVWKAFISSIWVRIVVVLSSITFCVAFAIYVICHWLADEQ